MRCSCCGHTIADDTARCPRCDAEQTPASKRRRAVITVIYALVAILLVMLLVYLVLSWHDAQMVAAFF